MIRLILALSLLAAPSAAAPCYDPDHLKAFLKVEHGLRLHSWGLDDDGNMMELMLGDSGHFAVVTTTPHRCASVAIPHKFRARLWLPPQPNKAIPPARMMTPGWPI